MFFLLLFSRLYLLLLSIFTYSLNATLLGWHISHVLKSWTTFLALKQSRKGSFALPFITFSYKPRLRSDGQSADWLIPYTRPLAGEPLHWLSCFTHRRNANTEDLLVKVWRWQRGCSLIWRGREQVAAADRRLERWTQASRFDCVNWNLSAAMSRRVVWRLEKSPKAAERLLFCTVTPRKRRFCAENQLWTSLSFRNFSQWPWNGNEAPD